MLSAEAAILYETILHELLSSRARRHSILIYKALWIVF